MLKIRRPLGRLIFNMGIAIPGKTVLLIETAPRFRKYDIFYLINHIIRSRYHLIRDLSAQRKVYSCEEIIIFSLVKGLSSDTLPSFILNFALFTTDLSLDKVFFTLPVLARSNSA